MKRLIAMLLAAALLMGCAPALAESAEETSQAADTSLLPTLHISAEYFDWTKDGAISGDFVLECRYPEDPAGNASGAPGTVLSIEGLNGLTLAGESPEKISVGDLSCGETFEFSLSLQYDESLATQKNEQGNIEPILHIAATSGAIGGCSYTCIFDITPTPRAYLLGVNTEPYLLNAYSCAQGIDSLAQKLEGFYYDTQPLEVHSMTADISDPGAQDILSLLGGALHCGADENDVTYIYLCAQTTDENGAPVSGVRGISGGRSVTVGYDEILSKAAEELAGRIILICDGQYGGLAPYSAAVSALDPEYCNVIGVNSPTAPEGSAIYTGLLAQSMAEMQGTISVSGFTGSVSGTGSAVNSFLKATTGSVMTAYHSGSSSNLFFSSDPNFDSGVRILAVKEEKCIVMPLDPLELYYQYLREIAVPAEGLATPGTIMGTEHLSMQDQTHWDDLAAKGGQGFASAAVNDFDKDGAMDMIAVYAQAEHVPFSERKDYAHPEWFYNADDNTFCWYLRLYQIVEGEVVMTDSLRGTYMDTGLGTYWGDGSVYIRESEGMIYITIHAGFIGIHSEDGACGETVVVQDGKLVPLEVFDPNFNTMEHGVYAYFNDYPELREASVLAMFDLPGDVSGHEYKYVMEEYNDLGAILREEIEEHYYEIVVYPDYVAPPFNEAAEAKGAAVHGAMQSLFSGEEVTLSYDGDDHTSSSIQTSSGVHCSVRCSDDGSIRDIWITSPTAPKHWSAKFNEIYQTLITLPALGLTEEEIASMPRSLSGNEEHFESSNRRITGFVAPDPMTCEWLNLVFYID